MSKRQSTTLTLLQQGLLLRNQTGRKKVGKQLTLCIIIDDTTIVSVLIEISLSS